MVINGLGGPPSWTDTVVAVSTFGLAVLALASAIYARLLWLEARKQFAELKRSTDTDVTLRILERCDELRLTEAEAYVRQIHRDGTLLSFAIYVDWLQSLPSAERARAMARVNDVFTLYEQIGMVVRKVPSCQDVVIEHLALRAPEMLRFLRALLDESRKNAPLNSCEFERLALACDAFATRSGANNASTDV
jgi:hypothetical protein